MKRICLFVLIISLPLILSNCTDDPEPSLYDPNWTSGAQPVISSISPDSAFAGIGVITINGSNFSTNPLNNFVYFNKSQGTVLSASANQLMVKTAPLVGDSIEIKIAVHGAELFSEKVMYKLFPAVEPKVEFNAIKTDIIEQADQIACDADGNLYYTLERENSVNEMSFSEGGLYYVPVGGEPEMIGDIRIYQSIKVGPNNDIYALYGSRKRIYVYPAGGGDESVWSPNGLGGGLTDFEFDADLNVWVVGAFGDAIYSVTPDKELTKFDFEGEAQVVGIYNDALYVGAARDSIVKIYKLDIFSSDSIGTETEYLDLSSLGTTLELTGITFSAEGNMIFSANTETAVFIAPPGGGSFEPLYPELFDTEKRTHSIVWGPQNGTNIFVARGAVYSVDVDEKVGDLVKPAAILRVDTQSFGAPNFGRGDM